MKTIEEFKEELYEKAKSNLGEWFDNAGGCKLWVAINDTVDLTIDFVQRWIPVNKELPKDSAVVILLKDANYEISTGLYYKNEFRADNEDMDEEKIISWQPIKLE